MKIEVTDRYDALGIKRPGPSTMCKGQCEGTGFVPVSPDDNEEPYKTLRDEAEKRNPSKDGWHFVKCPECNGNGELYAEVKQ